MTQLQPFVGADSLRKAQALFLTNLEDAKKNPAILQICLLYHRLCKILQGCLYL